MYKLVWLDSKGSEDMKESGIKVKAASTDLGALCERTQDVRDLGAVQSPLIKTPEKTSLIDLLIYWMCLMGQKHNEPVEL